MHFSEKGVKEANLSDKEVNEKWHVKDPIKLVIDKNMSHFLMPFIYHAINKIFRKAMYYMNASFKDCQACSHERKIKQQC